MQLIRCSIWTKSIILLILLGLATPFAVAGETPLKIAFVISRGKADMFYGPVVGFMQAAADDLGVELQVIETHDNHLIGGRLVKAALQQPSPPNGVIAVSVKESGVGILKACEEAKIPFMVEDSAILSKDIGAPREKHPYYIGAVLSDDEVAGYELGKYLIAHGKKAADGKVHVVAISGPFGTSASVQREKGLARAIKEFPEAQLEHTVRALWDPVLAGKQFTLLKDRFPNVSVVWAASDGMALGTADAAEKLHLKLGKDVVIGGVDWTEEGVAAVKSGRIQATAGGHFMAGAWSLITMVDYLRGHDFAPSDGVNIKIGMHLLTAENATEYSKLIDKTTWPSINFRSFSRQYNPKLTKYSFTPNHVSKAIKTKAASR